MKVKIDTKVCGVCGDKALGYNFNAVTCESCKAFFRRNALVRKEFKCPFNNNCEITKVTRRFCQKCRLDKCISIGMCKDLIMSEQDKVAKRQKIEENRAKKRSHEGFKSNFKKVKKDVNDVDSEDSETCSNTGSIDSNDLQMSILDDNPNDCNLSSPKLNKKLSEHTNENTISSTNEIIGSVVDESSTSRDVMCSCKSDESHANKLIDTVINNNKCISKCQIPGDVNSNTITKNIENTYRIQPIEMDQVLCEAIKLEYEMFPSIAQYRSQSKELNEAEQAKLNELLIASKYLLAPIDNDLNNLMGDEYKERQHKILQEDPALVDIVNLTGIGIRRVIIMAKKISAFKNLCQEDQVALLKGGCTEIMLLRSALNYDQNQKIWQIPHTMEALRVHVDILKQATGNIYQLHESFIKTFEHRMDENIILILCAIILFTPERPKVVHGDVIKLEQNSYYYLLRRYLDSIYSGCEARSTFLKLIHKISEIHKVSKEFINVYLGCNPMQVEPLLIEIFDLKCKGKNGED